MRRAFAALLAGVLLGIWVPLGAAPFRVQLGSARLVFDTPVGFSDSAGFGSPRLTELAENLTEASSRVLVFALSDADARRFSAGDSLELRRYLLAVTPRAGERERISREQFSVLKLEARRALGKPLAGSVDYAQFLKDSPAGQSHLLAELRNDPEVLSLLLGTMAPRPPPSMWREDLPTVFKLSTTSLALIGGKAIYISAFTTYEGPADVAWISSISERWIEDLRRMNR